MPLASVPLASVGFAGLPLARFLHAILLAQLMTTPPDAAAGTTDESSRCRITQALEHTVAQVKTPQDAEAVTEQLEQAAAGKTEATEAERAPATAEASAQRIEASAAGAANPRQAAQVLTEATAATVRPGKASEPAKAAAQATMGPGPTLASPGVEHGRSLLRAALLRRMAPLHRLDAFLYLAINGIHHPAWADTIGNTIATCTNGGWFWALALVLARLAGVSRAGRALSLVAPVVAGTTWTVEYPIKALFRRRRPFIDNVSALVVGKRPGSWSFPSGHTASAFSGAWVLSTYWPRRAPVFFAVASAIGFSRIYVGAHFPGDVVSGAASGVILGELIRRTICTLMRLAHRR